jgi:tRNA(His) 5'-end guanylyltransferase
MSLEERMKSYEKEECIKPQNAFIARMNGKNFSGTTKKFNKPDDPRFTEAMVLTLNKLMVYFDPSCGFCCSDEITLVFPPTHSNAIEHDLNGRKNKISTLCAGKCSALFLINLIDILSKENDAELLQYIMNNAPCFDCCIIEISADNLQEVCNNLLWRSVHECRKNTVSAYARYVLGTREIVNKNENQLIELMKEKGFDINTIELYKVYGVYAKKKKVLHTDSSYGTYNKNVVFNFECIMKSIPEMTSFILDFEPCSNEKLQEVKVFLGINSIRETSSVND